MKDINKILEKVIETVEDRKAVNPVILDMKNLTPMADYFMICNGTNERQVQAIARALKDTFEEEGYTIKRMEGFDQARWILIDTEDIVCHVFHEDERLHYNLERLWGDAAEVTVGK